MDIMNYIKPELVVVAVVLYFLGMWIKSSSTIKDKFIPLIVGVIGIILAMFYVVSTSQFKTWQDILMAVFVSIIQGILCAGLSTYVNQLLKQHDKEN